jgi:hypothetical protein
MVARNVIAPIVSGLNSQTALRAYDLWCPADPINHLLIEEEKNGYWKRKKIGID